MMNLQFIFGSLCARINKINKYILIMPYLLNISNENCDEFVFSDFYKYKKIK